MANRVRALVAVENRLDVHALAARTPTLDGALEEFYSRLRSDESRRAYRADWVRYLEWLNGMPPVAATTGIVQRHVNYLLEKGPQTEHWMMWEAMEEEYQLKDASKRGMDVLLDLYALWLVRKLWRRKMGIHPGSGEDFHIYGVRGVHVQHGKH